MKTRTKLNIPFFPIILIFAVVLVILFFEPFLFLSHFIQENYFFFEASSINLSAGGIVNLLFYLIAYVIGIYVTTFYVYFAIYREEEFWGNLGKMVASSGIVITGARIIVYFVKPSYIQKLYSFFEGLFVFIPFIYVAYGVKRVGKINKKMAKIQKSIKEESSLSTKKYFALFALLLKKVAGVNEVVKTKENIRPLLGTLSLAILFATSTFLIEFIFLGFLKNYFNILAGLSLLLILIFAIIVILIKRDEELKRIIEGKE